MTPELEQLYKTFGSTETITDEMNNEFKCKAYRYLYRDDLHYFKSVNGAVFWRARKLPIMRQGITYADSWIIDHIGNIAVYTKSDSINYRFGIYKEANYSYILGMYKKLKEEDLEADAKSLVLCIIRNFEFINVEQGLKLVIGGVEEHKKSDGREVIQEALKQINFAEKAIEANKNACTECGTTDHCHKSNCPKRLVWHEGTGIKRAGKQELPVKERKFKHRTDIPADLPVYEKDRISLDIIGKITYKYKCTCDFSKNNSNPNITFDGPRWAHEAGCNAIYNSREGKKGRAMRDGESVPVSQLEANKIIKPEYDQVERPLQYNIETAFLDDLICAEVKDDDK